ncbi:hypothetical protein HZB07_00930 [Candidatus Saganbacteria bacterium]|nr:hypothetical protein [Candidatus Saganbacteria bacterium]
MANKLYGKLLETVTDVSGRKINLYLNSYKHIINKHNKFELWIKHWKRVMETVKPDKNDYYEDLLENSEKIQIRVIKEKGEYLIKTAIIGKGVITKWKRI